MYPNPPEVSLFKYTLGLGPSIRKIREAYGVSKPSGAPPTSSSRHRRAWVRSRNTGRYSLSGPTMISSRPSPTPPTRTPPPPADAPGDDAAANNAAGETPPAEEKKEEEKKPEPEPANGEEKKAENGNGGGGEEGQPKEEANAEAGKGVAAESGGAFTAEQDAKLKEMKAVNKPWKEIAAEMKLQPKDIGSLRTRWKELNGRGGAAAAPAPAPAARNGGGKAIKKEKGKGRRRGGEFFDPDDDGAVKLSIEEVGPDEHFTAEDLAKLLEIIQTDHSNGRWLRVASDFFDETGRREHPDDIKAKFARFWS